MKKLTLMALAVASTTAYAQSTTDSVNVNVNPNDTLLIEVNEFATGSIATIGGADEDGDDNVTITLSTSDFSVTPATASITSADGDVGQLEPNVTLDYSVQNEYVFDVTMTDQGGLSATATAKVKVNPLPLGDIKPDTISVAENNPSISIFGLSTERTLPNGNVQTLTNGVQWEILSVDGVAHNPMTDPVSISGTDIVVAPNLNHEQQSVYAVEVNGRRGNTDTTDIIYLVVTNVNESPFKIYVK